MVSVAEKQWRRLLRVIAIALAAMVGSVLLLYLSIPMNDTEQQQFDVILVLGNPANADGSIAPIARSRVMEGLRQYRAGVAPRMLMSGGAAQNRFVEAQVMRQFAVAQGVPEEAVFAEGESRNTIQNAYYSYKLMQARGWHSALVVSSPTHLRRASLIFSRYPLAWRMDAAPWPPGLPVWKRLWFWGSETGYTSYERVFGFRNAKQFLPQKHSVSPEL